MSRLNVLLNALFIMLTSVTCLKIQCYVSSLGTESSSPLSVRISLSFPSSSPTRNRTMR